MALYFIGDLHSCCTSFKALLERVDFSPSRDEAVLLGDMINRGPQTLETLETIMQYDGAIHGLLGNHEIHFLAVACNLRKERLHDTIAPILNSSKRAFYVDWIRQQHMALYQDNWLAVHAGVAPQWTLQETLAYAQEVETILRSADIGAFLQEIFGNQPDRWDEQLTGIDRLRVIVNALTRIRFCTADGRMDMSYNKGVTRAPEHLTPWFNMPERKAENTNIVFGHWAMLEDIFPAPQLMALDTGCFWKGVLTAARVQDSQPPEIIQVLSTGVTLYSC